MGCCCSRHSPAQTRTSASGTTSITRATSSPRQPHTTNSTQKHVRCPMRHGAHATPNGNVCAGHPRGPFEAASCQSEMHYPPPRNTTEPRQGETSRARIGPSGSRGAHPGPHRPLRSVGGTSARSAGEDLGRPQHPAFLLPPSLSTRLPRAQSQSPFAPLARNQAPANNTLLQAAAINCVRRGQHVVISTATSSGRLPSLPLSCLGGTLYVNALLGQANPWCTKSPSWRGCSSNRPMPSPCCSSPPKHLPKTSFAASPTLSAPAGLVAPSSRPHWMAMLLTRNVSWHGAMQTFC